MSWKSQADLGLGRAIAYFTNYGYTVSIPLTDSQPYDLVVDMGDRLVRVQVKTTSYKVHGFFVVALRTCGGNRSGAGKITRIDAAKVDYLFAVTTSGEMYLIPTGELGCTSTIALNETRAQYRVAF